MTEKEIKSMPKDFNNIGEMPTSRGLHKRELDRYLGYAETISFWKKGAFILFVLSVVSIGANIYLSTRNTIVPYVVTVTSNGDVLDVGKINYKTITPTDAQIVYFVNGAIRGIREIPFSKREYAEKKENARVFLTPSLYNKVYTNSLLQDVVKNIENGITRDVKINTFTKLENESGYLVKWTETTRRDDGSISDISEYQSIVNIALVKSDNIEEIKVNPLGLKITNMTTQANERL